MNGTMLLIRIRMPGSFGSEGAALNRSSLIEDGYLIQVLEHHDRKRCPNQLLYEVDVNGYVYVVPVMRVDQTLFLKTIYPGRKAT